MKYKKKRGAVRRIAALFLTLALGNTSAVQAAGTYSFYELQEEAASEYGYIPAYDPAEAMDEANHPGTGVAYADYDRINEEDRLLIPDGMEDFRGDDGVQIAEFQIEDPRTEEFQVEDGGEGSSGTEEGAFSEEESQDGFFIEEGAEEPEENGAVSGQENGDFSEGSGLEFQVMGEEGPGELVFEELPAEEAGSGPALYRSSALPEKFSLVEEGYGSEVENQGSLGICWAFSTLESIETGLSLRGLAPSGLNLSETHLAYTAFHGRNDDPDDATAGETFLPYAGRWTRMGGNKYYSSATLARGYGAAYEADFPLSWAFEADKSDLSGSSSSILDGRFSTEKKKTCVSRLRSAYWLLDVNSAGTLDERVRRINEIKNFIYTSGAVEMAIRTNGYSAPYDPETNSFYTPEPPASLPAKERERLLTPNHSVALVGWDDTKKTKATALGAFLIQNSWGTEGGENGLFWISYEDCTMKSPTYYEMENEPVGEAADYIVHQYDGTGYNSVIKPAKPRDDVRISGANVFQAKEAQYLQQVGFFAGASGLSYTISVYRYVSSTPDTGFLVAEKSGYNPYSGYYTVDLDEPVPIAPGEKFAVALTFDHPNGYIPHEKPLSSTSSRLYTADYGQSFLYDGETWTDMMDVEYAIEENDETVTRKYACNICVKAFGRRTDDPISLTPAAPELRGNIASDNNLYLTLSETGEIITGYNYVVGTSPDFLETRKFYRKKLKTADLSAVFENLPLGTYYAAVRAYRVNKDGTYVYGDWSDAVKTEVVSLPKPSAAVITAKVTSNNSLKITVKKSEEYLTGYKYVVGRTRDFLTTRKFVKQQKTEDNTFTFTGLSKGTYYVAARAIRAEKKGNVLGPWSKTVRLTVKVAPPSVPVFSSVTVSKGNRAIAVVKKPAVAVHSYEIALGSESNFAAAQKYYKKITVTGSRKAVFSYLPKGTYYAAARAVKLHTDGTKIYSDWSKTVKVTISAVTPGTPQFTRVTTGKGTLTAVYTKASDAYRYEYVLSKKSFSAGTYNPERYAVYTGRPFRKVSIKNQKKGTYYFGVRAYTLSGSTKVYGKWVVKKVTIQ